MSRCLSSATGGWAPVHAHQQHLLRFVRWRHQAVSVAVARGADRRGFRALGCLMNLMSLSCSYLELLHAICVTATLSVLRLHQQLTSR